MALSLDHVLFWMILDMYYLPCGLSNIIAMMHYVGVIDYLVETVLIGVIDYCCDEVWCGNRICFTIMHYKGGDISLSR